MGAFINNTPVVAFSIPLFQQLAERLKIPASKLMMPMAYAKVLGGTLSLIGMGLGF